MEIQVFLLHMFVVILGMLEGGYISKKFKHNRIKTLIGCFAGIFIVFLIHWILFQKFGWNKYYLSFFVLCNVVGSISLIDLKFKKIPVSLLVLGGGFGVINSFGNPNIRTLYNFMVAIGFLLVLYGVYRITKGAMGGGDVLLLAMISLITDVQMAVTILFLGIIIAGIFSGFLLLIKKVNKKTEIPFAPFLFVSLIIIIVI